MESRLIFQLLFFNVIIINFTFAYRSNERINYLDPRETAMRLMQPSNDLNNMHLQLTDARKLAQQSKYNFNLENWTGRWFPNYDIQPTPASIINFNDKNNEIHHSVPMGSAYPNCDNGKKNLIIDWDNSPVNYTCYGEKIIPSYEIKPVKYCEHIPPYYKAMHRCMNYTIEYDDDIPLYGTHRPVWPVYGEYKFLPRQRWIHSLEHGALVMLYHPCANPLEVQRLKNLVKKCLRRHIITRHNLLDIERPLALVTWGCRLTMSFVDEDLVTSFIHKKALRGPENIPDDGEFVEGLLTIAKIVSDEADSQLCPSLN